MPIVIEVTEGMVGGDWGPQEKGWFVKFNGVSYMATVDKPTKEEIERRSREWGKERRLVTAKLGQS